MGRSSAPTHVHVVAKRLDSEEVVETVTKVRGLSAELEIRAQLIQLVDSLYPDAEFRSFAGDAATFLAPKTLVVAVYRGGEVSDDSEAADTDETPQQQLFAA